MTFIFSFRGSVLRLVLDHVLDLRILLLLNLLVLDIIFFFLFLFFLLVFLIDNHSGLAQFVYIHVIEEAVCFVLLASRLLGRLAALWLSGNLLCLLLSLETGRRNATSIGTFLDLGFPDIIFFLFGIVQAVILGRERLLLLILLGRDEVVRVSAIVTSRQSDCVGERFVHA